MTRICLANVDYRTHMTDEGLQLQEGLERAGWKLVGMGYDGNRHVPTILNKYNPTHVFVQDKRDLDEASPGAFKKGIGFLELESLSEYDGKVFAPVKDAGSSHRFQSDFIQQIDADAVAVYYHPDSVLKVAEYLRPRKLIRTYHSIDVTVTEQFFRNRNRKRGIVTGAIHRRVYPVRTLAFANHEMLDIDRHHHPGYGNKQRDTEKYIQLISEYKTHIATASRYGFALRKIIESVAVGCTPITDLPDYDVLPEIDGALLRFDRNAGLGNLKRVIDEAEKSWDYDERLMWAQKATWYDFREIGKRLDRSFMSV